MGFDRCQATHSLPLSLSSSTVLPLSLLLQYVHYTRFIMSFILPLLLPLVPSPAIAAVVSCFSADVRKLVDDFYTL